MTFSSWVSFMGFEDKEIGLHARTSRGQDSRPCRPYYIYHHLHHHPGVVFALVVVVVVVIEGCCSFFLGRLTSFSSLLLRQLRSRHPLQQLELALGLRTTSRCHSWTMLVPEAGTGPGTLLGVNSAPRTTTTSEHSAVLIPWEIYKRRAVSSFSLFLGLLVNRWMSALTWNPIEFDVCSKFN